MSIDSVLLSNLLPPLFDAAVEALTRKKLLASERQGVLVALVNSIGTAVDRRAREGKKERIPEIETADRFSDEWISRSEIVYGIEDSSGLDQSLSELALTLIEASVETRASVKPVNIVGIGKISLAHNIESDIISIDNVYRNLTSFLSNQKSADSASLITDLVPLTWGRQYLMAKMIINQAVGIATTRKPVGYSITLNPYLSYGPTPKMEERVVE